MAALKANWKLFRASRWGVIGLVVLVIFILVAVFAPLLADPEGLQVTKATGGILEPPSREYWLGTDENGRSILTLLIWGSRISLFVGLCATVISMVIGTLVGLMSGFFEGWPAAILFRITEWFLVIPYLPLALILATVMGRSLFTISFVIGLTSWPATALLIRAQVLSIKERPYLERARVLGAGRWRQMSRHVLPNVTPMIFANTTLTVAGAILTRDHAELPRPRRPHAHLLGVDARGRLRGRRDDDRGVVVHRAARRVRRDRGAGLHPGRAGARRSLQPTAAGFAMTELLALQGRVGLLRDPRGSAARRTRCRRGGACR